MAEYCYAWGDRSPTSDHLWHLTMDDDGCAVIVRYERKGDVFICTSRETLPGKMTLLCKHPIIDGKLTQIKYG
jgi:hypothetical protein